MHLGLRDAVVPAKRGDTPNIEVVYLYKGHAVIAKGMNAGTPEGKVPALHKFVYDEFNRFVSIPCCKLASH